MAQESRRVRTTAEPIADVEDEDIEEPREEERAGDSDDEDAVVLPGRRVGNRDLESRQEKDQAAGQNEDHESRQEAPRRVDQARVASGRRHRAAILSATPRGSGAS